MVELHQQVEIEELHHELILLVDDEVLQVTDRLQVHMVLE
jgi:hypothetical protein